MVIKLPFLPLLERWLTKEIELTQAQAARRKEKEHEELADELRQAFGTLRIKFNQE